MIFNFFLNFVFYFKNNKNNEINQTEDPNPELNEENLELNEEENPKDELHRDLNQLRILSDELKNTREPSRVSLATAILETL